VHQQTHHQTDDVDQSCEIRIRFRRRPPEQLYGRLVLGCQWLVGVLEMGELCTVWPDETVVSDDDLNALRDHMDEHDPWAR
jgi:hypothetical protein